MAPVEVISVIIHYNVEPEVGVHVRIRHYAGTIAFLEETKIVLESVIQAISGTQTWDESHLVKALLPMEVVWGGTEDGIRLRADIKAGSEEPVPTPEQVLIAELRARVSELESTLPAKDGE